MFIFTHFCLVTFFLSLKKDHQPLPFRSDSVPHHSVSFSTSSSSEVTKIPPAVGFLLLSPLSPPAVLPWWGRGGPCPPWRPFPRSPHDHLSRTPPPTSTLEVRLQPVNVAGTQIFGLGQVNRVGATPTKDPFSRVGAERRPVTPRLALRDSGSC